MQVFYCMVYVRLRSTLSMSLDSASVSKHNVEGVPVVIIIFSSLVAVIVIVVIIVISIVVFIVTIAAP